MDTTFTTRLQIQDEHSVSLCGNITCHFTEGSEYNFVVTHNASAPGEVDCTLKMAEKGSNAFLRKFGEVQ